MKITVKRLTTEGLSDCEGTFFEDRGRQFCLTRVPDAKQWCAIELSTGRAMWGEMFDPFGEHPRKGKDELKELIMRRSDSSWNSGIELSKKMNSELGCPYPLNPKIG